MANKFIFVTQPYLPPLEEFIPYLQEIWDNKIITNGGAMHQELERQLCAYLGVPFVSLFTNGTIALVTALQSLRITGEVITTPYSFVATAHSLAWNGIRPVFVDVDPRTLNMDPGKIEAAITPQTTAILPVHCYGAPCNISDIRRIADSHNLKLIFDAAHAFGVEDSHGSILRRGDLSILSFHATKVFNTFEGGAIICNDARTKHRIDQLKNFGFVDELTVSETGINGKMSEINSAFGLLQLKHVTRAISLRKAVHEHYVSKLSGVPGISLLMASGAARPNYSYFPILVEKGFRLSRDALYEHLKTKGIFARRYFYPLISEFPMYRGLPSAARENLPVAYAASQQILCLPIYPELSIEQQEIIIETILDM